MCNLGLKNIKEFGIMNFSPDGSGILSWRAVGIKCNDGFFPRNDR
jgi:hypothetical protein